MISGFMKRELFGKLGIFSRQTRLYAAVSTQSQHSEKLIIQKLSNRGLAEIKGKDSSSFLQGLITNDIGCITHGSPLIYSMVLNAKGRVLYDIFIYGRQATTTTGDNDVYFLEAEDSQLDQLIKLFNMYKLRKKITITRCDKEFSVYSIFRNGEETFPPSLESKEMFQLNCNDEKLLHLSSDPRIKGWSSRIISKGNISSSDLSSNVSEATSSDDYTLSRYRLGIGEGLHDHPHASCLPLECNSVFLNGVSFNKGCYIGQELTARSHHTGVIRKRLMPIKFDSAVASNFERDSPILNEDGKEVGRYRSGLNDVGLALMRLSHVASGRTFKIVCRKSSAEHKLTVHTPFWWPDGIISA